MHLAEAQVVNNFRAPIYREKIGALGGDLGLKLLSRFISNKLVLFENLTESKFASEFDDVAASYETRVGFNLTCAAFVSMNDIGSIERPAELPIAEPVKHPVIKWTADLNSLSKKRDDLALLSKINNHLETIGNSPFDCMVRHVMESTRRLVELKVIHRDSIHDYPEFANEIDKLIGQHIFAIPGAGLLDSQAVPIHRLGVPIICNDVPAIPSLLE